MLDKGYSTHCTGAIGFIFQGLRSNFGFLMYPRLFSAEGKTPYPRLFTAEGSFPYPRFFIADTLKSQIESGPLKYKSNGPRTVC